MNKPYCAVITKESRADKHIVHALCEVQSMAFRCQFDSYLTPDYEYKGEHFCVLHLPIEEKQSRNLFEKTRETFQAMLKYKIQNYNFISAERLAINEIIGGDSINFIGATLWALEVRDITLDCLSLSYVLIQGDTIIYNCKINRFYIKNSDISSYFSLKNSNIELFFINNSKLHSNLEFLRTDIGNNSFHLAGSVIDRFIFADSRCEFDFKIDYAQIKIMYIRDTKFLLCPSFYNTKFHNENLEILLPNRRAFDLKPLIKQHSVFRGLFKVLFKKTSLGNIAKEIKNRLKNINKQKSIVFREQYNRFREIYNITKSRGMFLEQGEYFYLMQRCLDLTKEEAWAKRMISRIYRYLSEYGQSIKLPIIWLFLAWIVFLIFYTTVMNTTLLHALRISIQQLIKPFQLLFVDGLPSLIYLIGFIESIIFIICLPLLIIAFRWNFRKV